MDTEAVVIVLFARHVWLAAAARNLLDLSSDLGHAGGMWRITALHRKCPAMSEEWYGSTTCGRRQLTSWRLC